MAKTPNVYLDAARQLETAARTVRKMVADPSLDPAVVKRYLSEIHANIDAAVARLQWE